MINICEIEAHGTADTIKEFNNYLEDLTEKANVLYYRVTPNESGSALFNVKYNNLRWFDYEEN